MNAKILRILKRRSRSVLLLSYFRNHNIEFSKKVGVTCSRGTYNRYGIVCAHLADFIREVYGRKDMDFSDITLKTINDFDVYLRKVVKLKPNSVWVYMTTFKHIITLAQNEGIVSVNPFCGYRNCAEHVDRGFLMENELLDLQRIPVRTKSMELVRDLFVFSAYTGISYSDLKKLKKSDVRRLFDGNLWIVFRRKKTHTDCSVRLLETPLGILEKYSATSKGEAVFRVPCNAYCNMMLVKIMENAGIHRKITFHGARHTFATMLLSNGMPIETVSRLLGHCNIKTTQIYAKITNEKISRDMDLLAELLKDKSHLQMERQKNSHINRRKGKYY